mmetsp:Transcript_11922/g.18500  ORF Transcript_11922/g.18500 Transcript_11922/m.18500 type:complete len:116 (-) Transcript_11922:419-766(-)
MKRLVLGVYLVLWMHHHVVITICWSEDGLLLGYRTLTILPMTCGFCFRVAMLDFLLMLIDFLFFWLIYCLSTADVMGSSILVVARCSIILLSADICLFNLPSTAAVLCLGEKLLL